LSVRAGAYTIREMPRAGWEVTAPFGGVYPVTVAGGAALTGQDFGNHYTVASISGAVWNDRNGDGVRDATEPALAGWTVYADLNNNGKLDSGEPRSFSSNTGNYKLTLSAGTYTIREVARAGWKTTAPADGAYTLTVAGGDAPTGKDFGNQYTVATIAGTAWNDLNGNGLRETAEPGMCGWLIYADANANGKLDPGEVSAVTRADGSYKLTVAAGTYMIREMARPGWQVTAPVGGAYTVTVAGGGALTGQDFGNQFAAATVLGRVFNDINGDGVRDTTSATAEPGMSGVRVYADLNGNGQPDQGEPQTYTCPDGSYKLLATAGSFALREVPPAGWKITAPVDGSYSVTLTAGQTLAGQDFGNQFAGGTVSGVVFLDADGDGLRDPGEIPVAGMVILVDANSPTMDPAGSANCLGRIVHTGPDGSYLLKLAPGQHTISQWLPVGFKVIAPVGGSYTVTVQSGDALTGMDFADLIPEVIINIGPLPPWPGTPIDPNTLAALTQLAACGSTLGGGVSGQSTNTNHKAGDPAVVDAVLLQFV
jgi:hypothetical protein